MLFLVPHLPAELMDLVRRVKCWAESGNLSALLSETVERGTKSIEIGLHEHQQIIDRGRIRNRVRRARRPWSHSTDRHNDKCNKMTVRVRGTKVIIDDAEAASGVCEKGRYLHS